jgi:hypothetical protein
MGWLLLITRNREFACYSRRPNNQTIGGFLLQRFAKVPVHAATILKCAEAAIILERIRELTVGDYGRGQFCEATAKWWAHSTPWISIRRVQEIIKRLVDEGYAIRVQNYEAGTGHKTSSMYAMTARGLEILSIQKVSDLVNPEAIEANDKEIKAYLDANAGSRAYPLTQDSAQPTAGFRARDARDSAHLLDSSSNKQYEVNSTLAPLAGGVCAAATEQQPEKAAVISLPPELSTPEFAQAWEMWKQHRIEKKQKLTPITTKRQLSMLSSVGVKSAIAAIERSICNGWTGLFPEERRSSGRHLTPETKWAKI